VGEEGEDKGYKSHGGGDRVYGKTPGPRGIYSDGFRALSVRNLEFVSMTSFNAKTMAFVIIEAWSPYPKPNFS